MCALYDYLIDYNFEKQQIFKKKSIKLFTAGEKNINKNDKYKNVKQIKRRTRVAF